MSDTIHRVGIIALQEESPLLPRCDYPEKSLRCTGKKTDLKSKLKSGARGGEKSSNDLLLVVPHSFGFITIGALAWVDSTALPCNTPYEQFFDALSKYVSRLACLKKASQSHASEDTPLGFPSTVSRRSHTSSPLGDKITSMRLASVDSQRC